MQDLIAKLAPGLKVLTLAGVPGTARIASARLAPDFMPYLQVTYPLCCNGNTACAANLP
jgi:hypothetical protein